MMRSEEQAKISVKTAIVPSPQETVQAIDLMRRAIFIHWFLLLGSVGRSVRSIVVSVVVMVVGCWPCGRGSCDVCFEHASGPIHFY